MTFAKSGFGSKQLRLLLCLVALIAMTKVAHGQTVVDVRTSVGNFSIELFDTAAPATVANFLNYVNSGRYNGVLVHRSVSNFVVQVGLLALNPTSSQLEFVQVDPPVVNEFNQSNTRGTLAMAKVGGDPNSATSQWFVNLADNGSNLDSQNGGFTVFGRVLGDGMSVVDALAALPVFNAQFSGVSLEGFPLQNYDGGAVQAENYVALDISVAPALPDFQNSYVPESGVLRLRVALSDGALIELDFNQQVSSPGFVFQVLSDSVKTLTASDTSFAQFDLATGELVVPELAINGTVAGRNVRFNLTDSQQLLFTLISFDPI